MLKQWVLVYAVTLYSTLAPPERESEVQCSLTRHGGANHGHFCRWHVFESLWFGQVCGPHPNHTAGKPTYSATGEVSSLRLLTNYSLRLWRAQSELLAKSVFLARVKVKTCAEIEENALESKATPVSCCTVSLSAEEEDGAHVVRAKESSLRAPGDQYD